MVTKSQNMRIVVTTSHFLSPGEIMVKGFRIGHMVDMKELMLVVPLSGAEVAMKDL